MADANDTKLKTALGFAQKAGKLASGEFAVEKALRRGDAKLIVLDEAASDGTKKRWRDACAYRNVPLITVRGMGEAIGKPQRTTAAVTDIGFSAMLLKSRCDN